MFPRRSRNARLRARGVQGALPPRRQFLAGLRPTQGRRVVWGAAGPPILYLAELKIKLFVKLTLSRVVVKKLRDGNHGNVACYCIASVYCKTIVSKSLTGVLPQTNVNSGLACPHPYDIR